MAPPDKFIPLPNFESFPNKLAFVKLVRNYIRGKEEGEAIDIICNTFPKTMINAYHNKFLDDSFEGEMTAEELLEHVEECVKEQDLKDTLQDKAVTAYSIRFPFGSKDACQKLVQELYGRFRVLLKEEEKSVIQKIVLTRFLSLIPYKMGRELIEKFENPTYDDVMKFAAERDKKYEIDKKHKQYQEEARSKDPTTKNIESKAKGKSLDNKNTKFEFQKKENLKVAKLDPTVKIAFYSNTDSEDVAKATVHVKDCGNIDMYLDSCSSINVIPKESVERMMKLSSDIKVIESETYAIKGIHSSYSTTKSAVELVISIPNTEVKEEKVKFFIDEEAACPLLSNAFLRQHNINPIGYVGSKELQKFGGMTIGNTSKQFIELLENMPLLYSEDSDYPNNVCTAEFQVNDSYVPCRKKILPVPKGLEELVKNNIAEQIEKGWLEPVPEGTIVDNINSMVVVKKDDNKVRVCYNCTHVNNFISLPEDLEELPCIKDLLHIDTDRISLFDIKSAFNRINVTDYCKQFLILGTPYGLFRSKVLIFGLKISPYIWMKTLKKVLEPVIGEIKIYYDDIVNLEKGEKHDLINCKIIECLNRAHMQLTAHKCAIGVHKGRFLGYLIECPIKISIPRDRVEALLKLPCPTNYKEVMEVMGRFQYFAPLIPAFAEISAPIYEFKNRKGPFGEELQKHFDKLKCAAAKSISLEAIRKGCMYLTIWVSTSNLAICSLMQACYKKEERIFAVGGRKLRLSEKNYGKLEKVLLAVKEIIAQNRYIAAHFDIMVYSSAQGVQKAWESELGIASSTSQRLINELKGYMLQFKYVKDNRLLSQMFLQSDYSENYNQAVSFVARVQKNQEEFPIDAEELKKEYLCDQDARLLKVYIEENFLPHSKLLELNPVLRSKLDKLEIRRGIIYIENKLFIPRSMCKQVGLYLHRYHYSFDQMSKILKCNYIGYKLNQVIKDIADSCETCLTYRRNSKKQISHWPKTEEVRERFHSDCGEYGPHKFMINCDAHTTYCFASPVKGFSSKEIVAAYIESYNRMDCPLIQVADNGRGYCANDTINFLHEQQIVPLFSIPRRPESNGCAEKMIGLIKSQLKRQDPKLSFKKALFNSMNALNNRIVDGLTVKQKFFGYTDKNLIYQKYEYKSYPFLCNIKYKLDREQECWQQGKCLERIGTNIFRICDIEEKKIYIRKRDSIIFLDEKGKAVPMEAMDKLVHQKNNKAVDFTTEFGEKETKDESREYIRIQSEEEFKEFQEKRKDILLYLATDGSTEKGKGIGGTIWGYMPSNDLKICNFHEPRGPASSAQFLEVAALERGLQLINVCKIDPYFKSKLAIVVDSDYLAKSISSYIINWERRGFITTKGEKIKHEKEWRTIVNHLKGWKEIIVLKAASHKNIHINEDADTQAKLGAQKSKLEESSTRNSPVEEGDVWYKRHDIACHHIS